MDGRACSVFFTVSCSGQGSSGATKAGRKISAEAGKPGKLSHGNEGGRSLLICFIFMAAL
ncbi:MAG: hypothetical protein EA344_09335 [Alkalicoccus sp.]|nr:MAG: hypothetical protein EA344_09335 [Alkalicoccus sp.]